MPRSKLNLPRGKPRGLRRDRDCRTCKVRGVKCDLNRPRCLPCVESGLECGGYPQRVVWAANPVATPVSRLSLPSPVEQPTEPRRGLSDEANILSSVELRNSSSIFVNDGNDFTQNSLAADQPHIVEHLLAFGHSLKVASLASGDKTNNFQTLSSDQGLKLIAQVDNFLQARIRRRRRSDSGTTSHPSTLAFSAAESVLPQDVDNEDILVHHRLEALKSLSQALNTADPAAFLGIAVFAFFEVVMDGVFGEWDCHLRGARSLLDYHCQNSDEFQQLSNNFIGFEQIVAYFGWWDTIGAVVRQSTNRAVGDQQGLIFDDWHRNTLTKDFLDMVGCPTETFWLFVSLAKGNKTDNLGELLTQVMAQLLKLGMDTTERGKCMDTYRCAAVIALLSWRIPATEETLPSEPSGTTLTFAVDRICQIIDSGRPKSTLYVHMATPAYLASMWASSPNHCKTLRNYWRNCQMGDIPRYLGAQLRCEESWRDMGLV
ncbi:unnamed protein product [Fusarium graminearum]|nr:hypothetical protein FG05_10674 [Fusarium graminearum]CAG1973115.1 unnamed protein product [Fusarium graminearum]CAG2008560.1 unnamed protein product [Fusarium graminearum]CZS79429.1 unnamed protein product [Fusarium graminearum]